VLQGVAGVIGWTPLGAVWSAPGDAATGDIGAAVLKLLIAIATVVLLWFAWRALVFAMTTSSQRLAHVRTYRGLGWFRLFPATAAGAVAARSATYWVRDARYHVSLIVVPVVPLLMMVPLAVVGVPPNVLALFPVPIMALFLGWSVHNDVAYDSTAIWLHVASSVPGKADRIGRLTPALLLGVPVIVLAAFITAPLFGDDAILPALIGLGLCILFAGLGLASVTSAQFPYPAVRPGDSPFAQPQAVGTASSLIQSFSFFFTAALSAPVAWLAWLTLIEGSKWALPTLGLGIALGLVYLAIGVWGGGRIFTRRGPAILAFSMRN
jgi:ABC-2 type transport system permease protein